MIKQISFILHYTRIVKLFRFLNRKKIKILMYHRVDDKKTDILPYYSNLNVSVKHFEEQMKYLSKNYNVISLNDIMTNKKENKKKIKRNSVIITFDDGYIDNYFYAYPILKKNNLPATIFLSTDYIGNKKTYWLNKLYYIINKIYYKDLIKEFNFLTNNKYKEKLQLKNKILLLEKLQDIFKFDIKNKTIVNKLLKKFNLKIKKKSYLSWKQINEMQDIISFGSHTHSHSILSSLNNHELENELKKSKNILSKIKNYVNAIAYPWGIFNNKVIKNVNKYYEVGLTTTPGFVKKDLYKLKRIPVYNNGKYIFASYIELFFLRKLYK